MLRYKKYPNGFSESITEALTCFRTEKRRFLAWFFASKKSKNTCQKHLLQKHIFCFFEPKSCQQTKNKNAPESKQSKAF